MGLGAGQIVTDDDLLLLQQGSNKKPIVRLVQAATQSIATATVTALSFGVGSEEQDTDAYHSETVNPTRVTPTKPGIYRVTFTVAWASNTATMLVAVIGKNGANVQPFNRYTPAATATAKTIPPAIATISINGTGDYIEGMASQNSGGALGTQASGGLNSVLEVEFVRDLP